LRRQHRLRAQADFQRVRREGQSWAHPLAVLWACRNELEHSRFGFSAGRSVGGAVARNRAKRRLREIVRRELPQIAAGWDIIFTARAATVGAEFDAIALAVRELLRRAGLMNSRQI
jgi:ribonuclease P protein component